MTLYNTLNVHLELDGATILAGRTQFHRSRGNLTSTTFQYDHTYLENPNAYQLDPELPLVSGTLQTRGLPGAFSDSAPDRWGRNLIKKRERVVPIRSHDGHATSTTRTFSPVSRTRHVKVPFGSAPAVTTPQINSSTTVIACHDSSVCRSCSVPRIQPRETETTTSQR